MTRRTFSQVLENVFDDVDKLLRVDQKSASDFKTLQYTVGTSAVQITAVPLTGRKSISLKALCSASNKIYIGNSALVTSLTGYPLDTGDSLSMDLDDTETIYAIATASSQTLYVLEVS